MPTESQELKEYFELVDNLVKNKVDFVISNGTIAHAEYLISKMVSCAVNSVNIFTGVLNELVYGGKKMQDSLSQFCQNNINGKINIIVQNLTTDEIKNHSLYKFVEEKGLAEQCDFYVAEDSDKESNHFCTMDNNGYRNELDDAATKAVANFNDPIKTSRLYGRFSLYLRRAKAVS